MMSKRLVLVASLVGLIWLPRVDPQKGGRSASSFRQNIENIRLIQQAQPIVQTQSSNFNLESYQQQQQSIAKSTSVNRFETQQVSQFEADSEPAFYGSVAGSPGVDFPALTRIPLTKFSCSGQPFEPGFYADEETGCQVFHLCFDGRKESFLCGIGTVFNQATLNCDYWHAVECSKSSQYYSSNSELGKSSATSFSSQKRIDSIRSRFTSAVSSPISSRTEFQRVEHSIEAPRPIVSTTNRRVESSFSSSNFGPQITNVGAWNREQRFQSNANFAGPTKGGSISSRDETRISPASLVRGYQSSASHLDDGQLESKIISVNMPQSATQEFKLVQVNNSVQDDVWRPISKSKTSMAKSSKAQSTTVPSQSSVSPKPTDKPSRLADEAPEFSKTKAPDAPSDPPTTNSVTTQQVQTTSSTSEAPSAATTTTESPKTSSDATVSTKLEVTDDKATTTNDVTETTKRA